MCYHEACIYASTFENGLSVLYAGLFLPCTFREFSVDWKELSGRGPRRGKMSSEREDRQWIKGMQKKVEEEMLKKEIDTLLYWKGELEKLMAKRPESLATFQIEIQNFIQRMQNRIRVIKSAL